jgi:hypothetical protein
MSLLVSLLKESNYTDAKTLLNRHPEVVHDTDSETGNHCIFYSLGSPELTGLILEMKPESIKLKTALGNNPLHVAAQINAPIETFKVLILHKKSCASVKNLDGKVPFRFQNPYWAIQSEHSRIPSTHGYPLVEVLTH